MYYRKLGWFFDHRQLECACLDTSHRIRELGEEFDPNYIYESSDVDFTISENRNTMAFHIIKLFNKGNLQALEVQGLTPIDYKKLGYNYENFFSAKEDSASTEQKAQTVIVRRFRYSQNERKALGQLGLRPIVPAPLNNNKNNNQVEIEDILCPGRQEKALREFYDFMVNLNSDTQNPSNQEEQNLNPQDKIDEITKATFEKLEQNKPDTYNTLYSQGIEPPGFATFNFNNQSKQKPTPTIHSQTYYQSAPKLDSKRKMPTIHSQTFYRSKNLPYPPKAASTSVDTKQESNFQSKDTELYFPLEQIRLESPQKSEKEKSVLPMDLKTILKLKCLERENRRKLEEDETTAPENPFEQLHSKMKASNAYAKRSEEIAEDWQAEKLEAQKLETEMNPIDVLKLTERDYHKNADFKPENDNRYDDYMSDFSDDSELDLDKLRTDLEFRQKGPLLKNIQDGPRMTSYKDQQQYFLTNTCETLENIYNLSEIRKDIFHSIQNDLHLKNICKNEGKNKEIVNRLESQWHQLRSNNNNTHHENFSKELPEFLEQNRQDDQSLAMALLLSPEAVALDIYTFMGHETASPLECKLAIIGLMTHENCTSAITLTRLKWANHHLTYLEFKTFIDEWLTNLFQGSDQGKYDPTLKYMTKENLTTPSLHFNWLEFQFRPVEQTVEIHDQNVHFNVLEYEDLREMNLGNDITSLDHKVSMIQLRDHVKAQLLSRDSINTLIHSLEREAHHAVDEDLQQIRDDTRHARQRLFQIEADLQTDSDKLEALVLLRGQFEENLEIPRFGLNNEVEFDNLRLIVPTFNYEMDHCVPIKIFWKKLISFGIYNRWSEQSFKSALSGLLQGTSFETFYNSRDEPLATIANQLYDRYHKQVTVLDKETELENLNRNDGETMQSFCVRLMILIHETAILDPQNAQQRQDHILRTKIKQQCSREAYNKLTKIRTQHSKAGATLTIEQIKHIVMDVEQNSNYIHQSRQPPIHTHAIEANMTARTPPTFSREIDRSRSRSRGREQQRQRDSRSASFSRNRMQDYNALRKRPDGSLTPERQYSRAITPTRGFEKSNNTDFVRDRSVDYRSRNNDRGFTNNTPTNTKTFSAPLLEHNEPMPQTQPMFSSQNTTQPQVAQPQQKTIQENQQQQFQPQQQYIPQTTQPQQIQYIPQPIPQQQYQTPNIPQPQQQNFTKQNTPHQTEYPVTQYKQQNPNQYQNKSNQYQNQYKQQNKFQNQNKQQSRILQQQLLLTNGNPFFQSVSLSDLCLICNGCAPHAISDCPQLMVPNRQMLQNNYVQQNNNRQNPVRQNNFRPDYRPNYGNNFKYNNYGQTSKQNNYRNDYRQNSYSQNRQYNNRQTNQQTYGRQNNNRQYNNGNYNQRNDGRQQYEQNYRQNNNRQYNNYNNRQKQINYSQANTTPANETNVKPTQALNATSP